MLTKLFLERFMSYNERTEIELAPLTVLLGPNSSGKSSVLRALRTLRDFPNLTLNWNLESSPTYGRADTGFVIGAEVEVVSYHVEPGHLLGWASDGEEIYGDDLTVSNAETVRVEYEFDSAMPLVLSVKGDEAGRGTYVARHLYDDSDGDWEVLSDTFGFASSPWSPHEGFRGTVMDPRIECKVDGLQRSPIAPAALRRYLGIWEEMAPIRNHPPQLRPLHEDNQQHRLPISETNGWFTRLGIPYALVINELSFAGEQWVRRHLIDKRTGSEVWLRDVGTGISQVIPVVMACIHSKRDYEYAQRSGSWRLLTIEQPELHLHPRLQSEMSELLANTVWTRSDGFLEDEPDIESTGVQVLVETHSEHLVLRLQSLVRRKLIPHDEISLLYVWIENGSSKVKRIHLNSRGEFLDEWPEGFFDERLQEILGWSDDI